MTAKRTLLLAVVAASLFLLGLGAHPLKAQTAPPTQITPSNDTGTNPFGTYSTDAGNVNLSNGNLHLNIPLVSLPGRNGNFVLALQYDSKIWSPSAAFSNSGEDITYTWKGEKRQSAIGELGWRLSLPGVDQGAWDVDQYGNLVAIDGNTLTLPDGSKHYVSARGPVMDAEDGSSITGVTGSGSTLYQAYLKDGSTLLGGQTPTGATKIIEDTNGNYISSMGGALYDTLGRQITITNNSPTPISYKDSNGVTQTTTLNYTQLTLFQSAPGQYQTSQPPFTYPMQNNCGLCHRHVWVHQPGQTMYWMLTSVVLPDNTSYTFSYNGYGELIKITYPTGGYTAYDYGVFQHKETYWDNSSLNGKSDFREVTARRICRDPLGSCSGGTTEDKTTFAPIVDYTQPANQKMDVVDPQGYTNHYEFSWVYDDIYARYSSPRETLHQVYSETGTLLRTVTTAYVNVPPECSSCPAFPSDVTTTLNDTGGTTLVTKTHYDYDTFTATVMRPFYDPAVGNDYWSQNPTNVTFPIDNPTQILEYNYGSGAVGTLARKTVNTWLKVNAANGNVDYSTKTVHIWNRKSVAQVFDSGTTKFSETQYEYDSFTEGLTASGAVQHDSLYSTTYNTRGNLTAVKRWRNTDGASLTTRFQYDDAGNGRKAADPLGHTTTMSYADSWGNAACAPGSGNAAAFLTSVTNALGQITRATYNSCAGTMASVTDVNSQTTTYSYDLLNRHTQTTLPDGGQTTICYTDIGGATCAQAGPPFKAMTTKKIDSVQNLISTAVVDGLGRVTQTQLNSDPQGVAYTATTYDGLGRTSGVYNPTRCNPPTTNCGESTWGYTTTTYDALNRVKVLTTQDGGQVTTGSAGNTTTLTDQAGKKRQSVTDALGRLVQVFEPDANNNLLNETDYQYDVLGNLICAVQKGTDTTQFTTCASASATWRPRSFVYNSLSQLTSASNPESGTISYTYDNDGNLLTKTDARGIAINYSPTDSPIDALHRVTKKTYSDTTPAVTFTYDVSSADGLTGLQYPIGRLVEASVGTARTVNSYDPMGRVKNQWQCTPANCGSGWFSATYQYNAAGDLISATNPMGFTLTPSWNAANVMTGLASSWSDAQHPGTLATVNNYAPTLAETKALLGNGLTEARVFNNRLQPCRINVNSSGAALTACTDPAPSGNTLDFTYGYGTSTANNGNVMSWAATGAQTFSRTYTYDTLNRIGGMSSPGETCTGFSWTIDIWANRTDQAGTGGTCGNSHLTVNTLNRIADPNYPYDAAGNLTGVPGATSYQYDAENRMVSMNLGGASYAYDANGRRVRKVASGTTTDYFYDLGGNVAAERVGTTWTKGYVYVGSRLLVQYDNTVSPTTTFFAHQDHLSSTRLMTKMNQGTQECTDYLPYGEQQTGVCTSSGSVTTTHKFSGKERDPESGLDNFGARYDSSSLGRFMSSDPINLTARRLVNPANTLNKYVYGGNNPLLYVDPDGLDITVFYRQGQFGNLKDYGHIFIAATNQQTGKVKFLDFYPQGSKTVLNQNMTAERVKQHAAITIQTTPEVAQKVIDFIEKLEKNTPDYDALNNNCTTICQEAMALVGIDFPGGIFPGDLWNALYAQYSDEALSDREKLGNPFFAPLPRYQPGVDFGRTSFLPRGSGFSVFDLFSLMLRSQQKPPPRPCVETWDPKTNTVHGCTL